MNFGKMPRSRIKALILDRGLLKYECAECAISQWRGKKLSLHLDHINGVNNDNRLENLRFLCPNCHSQTETYCGKANKKNKHYSKARPKVTDEELLASMKQSKNIKEALDGVGLAGANNYGRVKRLAKEHGILQVLPKRKNVDLEEKLSGIDFGKFGWVGKASIVLGITPQKTRKFIERHAPHLLEGANERRPHTPIKL